MTDLLIDPITDPFPTDAPTGADLLDTVRRFSAEIDGRADEGNTARAVPTDLIDRLRAHGLFRMALPRSLGGLELDLRSIVEVFEEVSRADGSTGWTVLIGTSPMFFAWLDPEVATAMIGPEGDAMASSMFGPTGRAVPDGDGGLVLDGRWAFNSACVHADWHVLGAMVMDGEAPRLRPDGRPDWRFVFVPHDQVEVVDTWDAGGLRATASHDLVATGVRVPEAHTAMPMFDPARHPGPLWQLSFFGLLGPFMAAFPLGVARRALDEFAALAATKTRGGPGPTLAENDHVQVRYGQAEAGLLAARAFLLASVADLWETACRSEAATAEQEATMSLAVQQSLRAAVEAVDFAYTTAGGGAAYTHHPLQRCFRDIHTATQHLAFRDGNWTSMAAVRFGGRD